MSGLQEGRDYKIVNVKTGTVLDVSGENHTTVSGYTDQDSGNQKFKLEKNDEGKWIFRDHDHHKYIGLNEYAKDGTPLVATDDPFGWDIYHDGDGRDRVYRVFVPDAPPPGLNWDLSDHGNPNPGTIVTLWGKWEGEHQMWRFIEV
ncbi:hypothetical protein D9758_004362 [Tetrapyrgos nigripes]|uniref:Ricin B lectin domain-containing protein n=1 Tax=Tetrapyrgos nigripes TaxID=182062 RepID=A0A8H5GN22_9AGAR|nr:hypothetical protein D9758_004362 [Tetrapyrgos nigripes]